MPDDKAIVERDGVKRYADGKWAPGTKQGPGRGRVTRVKERLYYDRMMKACTLDDWEEICTRLVADAKAGEWRAVKRLFDYIMGPAVVAIQARIESFDTADGSQVTQLQAVLGQVLASMVPSPTDDGGDVIDGDK